MLQQQKMTAQQIHSVSTALVECVCGCVCVFPPPQCSVLPEHYVSVHQPFSLKPKYIQRITQVSLVSDRSFH